MATIKIQGARTHNLKNITLALPRDKLIVITGLSGSGKSSLAFDTLYAEGQRRYVESLSTYARQFLSMMDPPDVDHIEGLSPAIAIEQKATSHNPRSTVGTITEIYDYLRLLFARAGTPRCPIHGVDLEAQTVDQMVDQVLVLSNERRWLLLAPMVKARKGAHTMTFDQLQSLGFIRVRVNGVLYEIDLMPPLNPKQKHTIDVVVDRFKVKPEDELRLRLAESFEMALKLAEGVAIVADMDEAKSDLIFSDKFSCTECGYALAELEPRLFSFNNPLGACPSCDGLGSDQYFDENKIVIDETLPIAEGAIRGWDKRNLYYFNLAHSVLKHYGASTEIPYRDLQDRVKAALLYGSGRERIELKFVSLKGKIRIKRQVFEGIIPNMKCRYASTESQTIRDDLAKYLSMQQCQSCDGTRLREAARHVFVNGYTIAEITHWPLHQALDFFEHLSLKGHKQAVADKILIEIRSRLTFLINVGLNYLSLARSADTLSGGEAQRIRLASQIGSGLVGVMYVLDEPSIGLHQRDNQRLLDTLLHLRDLGNTVIVVEHDEDAIRHADHVVDIGPGAGVHGGKIIAQGTPEQIRQHPKSLTGQYLSKQKSISVPTSRLLFNRDRMIVLKGARSHNLKNISVEIPIGLMTCVTGVSGSGKSTLVNGTLLPIAMKTLNRTGSFQRDTYSIVEGLEYLDKVIAIDQSPIGRTPRSNPVTLYRDFHCNSRFIRRYARVTESWL